MEQIQKLISKCAEIQEIIPINELEQYALIEKIVKGLNICQAKRFKEDGYTNECFFNQDGSLTKEHTFNIKEKKKYVYIDCAGSGVFMVEKTTGNIFNIKGYGVINRAKCRGNINNIDVEELYQQRR